MTKTWEQVRSEIAGYLGDPTFQTFSAATLMNAYNRALEAFASAHTPRLSKIEYTGDGETDTFDLPANLISGDDTSVYGVLWSDGETWLKELSPTPGKQHASQNTYRIWLDKIKFYTPPTLADVVTLYYSAYYIEVDTVNSVIEAPAWAYEALNYYAMSIAISPEMTQRGQLAVWQQRTQSGNPEHNSLIKLAEYWRKCYWDILRVHARPQYDKIGT